MPYIPDRRRNDLAVNIFGAENAGEVNYVLTTIMTDYVTKQVSRRGLTEPNYQLLQEAHGTFLAAAAEWYRRVLAPYEDLKIIDHGDVYPAQLGMPTKRGNH